ncbi:hypothetical protein D3C72_1032940 [compost metagenome]
MIAPSRIIKAIGVNASTCASQMPVKPYSQLVLVRPNQSTISSVTYPERPIISVTPNPTTNGGVTIGRIEKMRPMMALRLAMRVV